MFIPAASYDEKQVEQAIQEAEKIADVVRVGFSFHEDWSAEPALYFRVLLKDRFDPKRVLTDKDSRQAFQALCDEIRTTIREQITEPDLEIYFSFRTVSEQVQIADPKWA